METRIKELRLSKKLFQRALGNIVNCSQNYISQIELEQTLPRADVLVAIAKHFGVSVDYILCLTDQQFIIEIDSPFENKQTVEYAKKLLNLSKKKRQALDTLIDIFTNEEEQE